MGRKRLVWSALLILSGLLQGCCNILSDRRMAEISVGIKESGYISKSMNPEENAIHNVSIFVFDSAGMLVKSIWSDSGCSSEGFTLELLSGKEYRFFACVNFGYRFSPEDLEDLLDHRFHMSYPDEYKEGIPMTGDTGFLRIEDGDQVSIELTRMMAKISMRIDRRKLSDDVEMKIRSVRIGNCPKSAKAFRASSVENHDECHSTGFYRNAEECSPLNEMAETGISKTISVYMLENMQGKFSETDIPKDCDKVFDRYDLRQETCSYIELSIDYISSDWESQDKGLIYRFYLGEDRNNLDVERNCHYRITVCPEDSGLNEDSWRIDKSDLIYSGPVSFSSWPESYIQGDVGDKVHIGCSFTPSFAPFEIGMEELMEDKANGIYDFKIDDDGHGVTLTLTGPGRGLVYMEVGEPVNEAAMWVIEVNLPDP